MTQDVENAFDDREGMGLALAFEQFAVVAAGVTTMLGLSGCPFTFSVLSSVVYRA